MNDVEQYLRSATRGLWGRKRGEVREELAAHIEERTMAFRLAGLSEEDATERVLSELGHPREVSVGMTKLYTAPWVAGSGILAAAVCAVSVTVASMGMAQSLPISYRWPSENCFKAQQDLSRKCLRDTPWTNITALKENLEPLGVKVSEQKDAVTLSFPDAQPVRLPLRLDPEQFGLGEGTLGSFILGEQLREGYYPIYNVVSEIARQAGVPVKLEGWENPTLKVGDTAFHLGTETQVVQGNEFYWSYIALVLGEQTPFPKFFDAVNILYLGWDDTLEYVSEENRRLEVGAKQGEIVGLVAWLEPTPGDVTLWFDIAPAGADGSVDLGFPEEPITFVNDLGKEPKPYTALLVRFRDTFTTFDVLPEREGEQVSQVMGLESEIISPEQISVVN